MHKTPMPAHRQGRGVGHRVEGRPEGRLGASPRLRPFPPPHHPTPPPVKPIPAGTVQTRPKSDGGLAPFDRVLIVIGLVLLWDSLLWIFSGAPPKREDLPEIVLTKPGDPVMQIIYGLLYASACLRLLTKFGMNALRLLDPGVAAVVLLAILSASWSGDPALTMRKAAALLGTTAFGLYLGLCASEIAIARLLHRTALVLAIASIAFTLAMPEMGIMPVADGGNWRGVFSHKNSLGSAMAMGLLAATFSLRVRTPSEPLVLIAELAGMGVMATALILSGSATALVIALTGCACALLLTIRGPQPAALGLLVSAAALLSVGIAIFVLMNLGAVAGAIGRDPTLTGRTPIWTFTIDMIGQAPLLGYGYAWFWSGWEAPGSLYWRTTGFQELHSHNGFLVLGLDLGFLGLGLFLLAYFRYFTMAIWLFSRDEGLVDQRSSRASAGVRGRWHFLYAVLLVLTNLTESNLVAQNGIIWVLFAAHLVRTNASAKLASYHADLRRKAREWKQSMTRTQARAIPGHRP